MWDPSWSEGGDWCTAGTAQPTMMVRVAGTPRHTKKRTSYLECPRFADMGTECAACSSVRDFATRQADFLVQQSEIWPGRWTARASCTPLEARPHEESYCLAERREAYRLRRFT